MALTDDVGLAARTEYPDGERKGRCWIREEESPENHETEDHDGPGELQRPVRHLAGKLCMGSHGAEQESGGRETERNQNHEVE